MSVFQVFWNISKDILNISNLFLAAYYLIITILRSVATLSLGAYNQFCSMEQPTHPKEKTVQQEETIQPPYRRSGKKQLFASLVVLLFLIGATFALVLFGKGYRIGLKQGEPQLTKTGLLNLTSTPTGAQVYVDGHLTTATNNTVNLTPGKYTITIGKDGYNDWKKDIEIQKEVVTNADATLFPKAPSLQSISTFGVESVVVDPSGTKLAFKIASQSAKHNGIYVLDMTTRGFPVLAGQSSSTQLVDDTTTGDAFSTANLAWSPDGKQLLASISGQLGNSTYYLLKTDGFNDAPQDVTATLQTLTDSWKAQRQDKEAARLKSLKPTVQQFANKYFQILSWSPDETKVLYQASDSAQMPIFLKPRRIGNNLLYERRDLQKGAIYVYDSTEDVNTRVVESLPDLCTVTTFPCVLPFTWFPDSEHLVYVNNKEINLVEDDGANLTTIYAGPFLDHYVFPWPDGSKIVILTNLGNQTVSPTLYTISLK